MFKKQNKPHALVCMGLRLTVATTDLKSLGNGAGTDAAGADLDGPNGAIVDSLHLLQVGVPGGTGFVVGMAHIVASTGAFTTNFAFS